MLNNLLGYILAQSALLYALLFIIINIYSVYSISVLGILTLFREIYHMNKFVFRSVRKFPPYLKYLLLRDKGWCLQAIRTAGHTLDFTSKPLLVRSPLVKDFCTDLFGVGINQK